MAAVLLQKPRNAEGSKFAAHYPLWGKGDPVIYWAQGGRVHCRDERPDTDPGRRFNSIHWREMAQRVLMYSQMIVTYKADGPEEARRWQFERQRAQKWICEMEDVLREAKEQCDRDDDAAFLNRKRPPATRGRSGDMDLEKSGAAGSPVSKRIFLPYGM